MIGGACCLGCIAGVTSGHRLASPHGACCGRARGSPRSPRGKATSRRGTRPGGRGRRRGWGDPKREAPAAASHKKKKKNHRLLRDRAGSWLVPTSLASGVPVSEATTLRGNEWNMESEPHRPAHREEASGTPSAGNTTRGSHARTRVLPASAPCCAHLIVDLNEGGGPGVSLRP